MAMISRSVHSDSLFVGFYNATMAVFAVKRSTSVWLWANKNA